MNRETVENHDHREEKIALTYYEKNAVKRYVRFTEWIHGAGHEYTLVQSPADFVPGMEGRRVFRATDVVSGKTVIINVHDADGNTLLGHARVESNIGELIFEVEIENCPEIARATRIENILAEIKRNIDELNETERGWIKDYLGRKLK